MNFLKIILLTILVFMSALSIADNLKFTSINNNVDIDSSYVAIDKNAKIWAWGRNMDTTVLGYDYSYKNYLKAEPVQIGNLKFKKVFSKDKITCANTVNNDTYCWGGAKYMVLGIPEHQTSSKPLKMPISFTQIAVASGLSYSIPDVTICVLDHSGDAWCWGMGKVGQLGNGEKYDPETTLSMRNYTGDIQSSPKKVKMPKDVKFTQIVGGSARFMALDLDGNVWQWGATGIRDVDDNEIFFEYPTKRKMPDGVKFTKLIDAHYLLDSNNNLWEQDTAYGDKDAHFYKKEDTINQKIASKDRGCLTTVDGDVWCAFNEFEPNYFRLDLPNKAQQLLISGSPLEGCILDINGKINCFYPTTKRSVKFVEVGTPENLKFKAMLSGVYPTYCALSDNGEIWCWCKSGEDSCFGDNKPNQLEVMTNIYKDHPYIKTKRVSQ